MVTKVDSFYRENNGINRTLSPCRASRLDASARHLSCCIPCHEWFDFQCGSSCLNLQTAKDEELEQTVTVLLQQESDVIRKVTGQEI
jgi:hypothetical protein